MIRTTLFLNLYFNILKILELASNLQKLTVEYLCLKKSITILATPLEPPTEFFREDDVYVQIIILQPYCGTNWLKHN